MVNKTFYINDRESFNLIQLENIEYGNPIKYYAAPFIKNSVYLEKIRFTQGEVFYPPDVLEKIALGRSIDSWNAHFDELMSVYVDPKLFLLLNTIEKKEQVKLLKGITLDYKKMQAFIFRAFLDYGFTFSAYKYYSLPSGTNEHDLPTFAYKEDNDTITKIGKTLLSDGQIKSTIIQRNAVVAKVLDNGKIWHCFFSTLKALKGEENLNTPHLHYISSTFGRERKEVLAQFERKKYKLPRLPHIPYYR